MALYMQGDAADRVSGGKSGSCAGLGGRRHGDEPLPVHDALPAVHAHTPRVRHRGQPSWLQ